MTCAILEDLIETIGLPATIELTRVYGGRTLHVPMTLTQAHPLALAIGVQAAEALSRAFSQVQIEVPAARAALLVQRNAAIVQAYLHEEASIKGLAAEYCLSRKMIRKILRHAGLTLRSEGTGPTH